jgi:hypothetical protein
LGLFKTGNLLRHIREFSTNNREFEMPKPKPVSSAELSAIRERLLPFQEVDRAKEVLSRLAASQRAVRALAEMQLDDSQLSRLLLSAADALDNARSFKDRIAQEKVMLGHLEVLDQSVDALQEFLKQVTFPPSDPLQSWISIHRQDKARYLGALREIKDVVANRRMIALETEKRIGATRNQGGEDAAINAGIGWLAASINKITKRTYAPQAHILVEVVFGKRVTEDRVRRAFRNFKDRKWRINE